MIKNTILSLMIVLVMSACGGSGEGLDDSSNTETPITENNTTQKVIVINGHTLPPEPDEALNNSTLAGIDSNNNGVRDDVERKIYLNNDKEISRQILLQSAKIEQKWLEANNLISNAKEWQTLTYPKLGCMVHVYRKNNINLFKSGTESYVFNSKIRIEKYMKYNQALSGGVYSSPNSFNVEGSCDFNITKALEAQE
ncbi:MAG: hypothetical protein COA44_12175 [Arcobacter sp.]|nr:MAG: hypothetical protein COA44_12175 [Arcobacter sp.]